MDPRQALAQTVVGILEKLYKQDPETVLEWIKTLNLERRDD